MLINIQGESNYEKPSSKLSVSYILSWTTRFLKRLSPRTPSGEVEGAAYVKHIKE